MSASLLLATVGNALKVEACQDRWRVTSVAGERLPHPDEWPREWPLSLQVSHLVDMGIASFSDGEISIPWRQFGKLDSAGYSLPLLWSGASPFRLSIRVDQERQGASYFLGGLEAAVERVGMYVRRSGRSFLLDPISYELVEAIERGTRAGEHRWIDLGFLSAYASETCATVSGWLAGNEVIFPAAILSGQREGVLRRTPERFIAEVSRDEFPPAPGARRILLPGERWRHIIFDDEQLAALRTQASPVTPIAGRIGTREAPFLSAMETLPVRLQPEPPLIAWHPHTSNRHRLVRTLTRTHTEALAAADFAVRGYDTIVLPRNCWTGASMMAVSDRDAVLVRVEARVCGEESLRATVRMAAEHRRLYDMPYRLAMVCPQGCDSAVRARAEEAGIQVLDRRGMLDASAITEDHMAAHEGRRCRSLREGVELLMEENYAASPVFQLHVNPFEFR